MTLRTALRIDGDASGAREAVGTASRELEQLGKSAKRAEAELAAAAARASNPDFAKLNGLLSVANIYFGQMEHQAKFAAKASADAASIAAGAIGQITAAVDKTANVSNLAGVAAGKIAALITPIAAVNLALTGVSMAAGYFFSKIKNETPSAEKALEEHARLIGIVKDAYKKAESGAGNFFKQSKAITLLQAEQNLIALQEKMRLEVQSVIGNVTRERVAPLSDSSGLGIPDVPMIMPLGREVISKWQEFADVIGRFGDIANHSKDDVAAFRNEIGKMGGADRNLAAQANKLLDETKVLGETAATVTEAQAAVWKLQGINVNDANKILDIATKTNAVAKETNEFTRAQRSVRQQAERLEMEAAAFGLSATEAARFRAEQVLLNAARAAGIPLTAGVVAGIDAQSSAMAVAAGKLKDLAERQAAIDYLSQTTSSFFSDLRQNLKDGEKGWAAWGDAVAKAVDRAIDKFLELAANDFWTQMLGGKPTSGLGSLWNFLGLGGTSAAAGVSSYMQGGTIVPIIGHSGGMAGMLGSSGRSLPPALLNDNIPRFHSGKPPLGPGELLAIVQDREEIITPSDPRHRWNGGGKSGSDPIVSVSLKVDARGAQQGAGEEIVKALQQWVKTPAFKAPVIDAVREAESRRMG